MKLTEAQALKDRLGAGDEFLARGQVERDGDTLTFKVAREIAGENRAWSRPVRFRFEFRVGGEVELWLSDAP